jgi:hypothetical protein
MTSVKKHLAVYGLLLLSAQFATRAKSEERTSRGPSVVELYTSQGCSSCPPADAVLGELASMPNTIALAFHVDYWNGLGWPDHYSLPTATERQRVYTRSLGLSSAFTPQAVVDGRASFVGSDKTRILSAMSESANSVPVMLQVTDGSLRAHLPERADHSSYAVYAAAYLPHALTPVGRGENSGRTLQEFNIVRQFRSMGTWKGQASDFSARLDSFPADAAYVAVLVQREPQGIIVGSAKIELPKQGAAAGG